MFEKLFSWENLLIAFRKAAKGKRGHSNVAGFEYRLEENLLSLQTELRQKTYLPGRYVSFYIHEPKKRLISAAPFRDRVVHHALCNIMEPVFERGFISDSYANRINKGTHRALNRCQEFARKFSYVLPCDLRQFFPSIDHTVLSEIIAKKISDQNVRWLTDRILKTGKEILKQEYDMVWFPGDDLFALNRPRGLPIGNLTSQFWANVYLSPFDHFVQRELQCRGYLRYVDDFLLFANEKKILWEYRQAIEKRLMRFRMTLHPMHPRPVSEGIPFLGFTVFPEHRRLKQRKGIHFQRHLKKLLSAFDLGEISEQKIADSVQGWVNHVRYGNTVGLRRALLFRQKTLENIPKMKHLLQSRYA